jgi:hypothetical protein
MDAISKHYLAKQERDISRMSSLENIEMKEHDIIEISQEQAKERILERDAS